MEIDSETPPQQKAATEPAAEKVDATMKEESAPKSDKQGQQQQRQRGPRQPKNQNQQVQPGEGNEESSQSKNQ